MLVAAIFGVFICGLVAGVALVVVASRYPTLPW